MALDQNLDDPRPFIEAAAPTHPSLIDSEHRVADLYGIINVPTAVWIDERGAIVRPNDVAFGSEVFKDLTGFDSASYLEAVRTWARDGVVPFDRREVQRRQMLPNGDEQQARAEFGLAWHLHKSGHRDAAVRHFERAGQLSPDDFTIRRGSMPIRGIDPMTSPEFLELWQEWTARGRPYYRPRSAG